VLEQVRRGLLREAVGHNGKASPRLRLHPPSAQRA
jgi:hypothetical protein